MDILHSIITLLNKEEQRNYKLYALRTHSNQERKDLELFDYIRKSGDKFNERKILRQLYGQKGKNAYNRLRNRLLNEVNKSLVMLHWDRDETYQAFHFLVLAMLFRKKQHFDISKHFLGRAEDKARQLEHLELLDMIYGEFIRLSFDDISINPEEYIQIRNKNRQTLNRLREIDNIIAVIHYRLKTTQTFGAGDTGVTRLLEQTLADFSGDPELQRHTGFRFRVYEAVSRILLEKRDYSALESYLRETLEAFVTLRLFHKGNHDSKLQMLTYLINCLIKNEKWEDLPGFADQLRTGMEEHNKILYDKYFYFYQNAMASYYTQVAPEKAIEILEASLQNEKIRNHPYYQVYININLAQLSFLIRDFRRSIRSLVKLQLLDHYKGSDDALKLRVTVFELAVRLELEQFDVLEYRLPQINRDFKELLEAENHEKDRVMITLIKDLNLAGPDGPNPKLLDRIRDFLNRYSEDDTEIFKYNEWLRAKIALDGEG